MASKHESAIDLTGDSEEQGGAISVADPISLQKNGGLDKKRAARSPATTTATNCCSVKKRRSPSSPSLVLSPIKLFATESLLRSGTRSRHPELAAQCWTLREMLGIDPSPQVPGEAMPSSPLRIEWLVVANYMVDFAFLLDQAVELISTPCVTVFYGIDVTSGNIWKNFAADPSSVDLVQLVPSDPARSRTNPLPARIPYSVHHSKIFLIGHERSIRVVISTANILHDDIYKKAQGAFIQDFPLKTKNSPTTCPFERDLIAYFATYHYNKQRTWRQGKPLQTLAECLGAYDFSSAQAVLIPSTPGYHQVSPDSPTELRGHRKLRHAIREHCLPLSAPQVSPPPIICQFSSIGSLSLPYLQQLQDSMDVASAQRPDHERPNKNKKQPLALQFVYPTHQEIETSEEGIVGGGTVPGKQKDVSKPFLRSLFRRWAAKGKRTRMHMSRNVPHIKSYYQIRTDCGDEMASMQWFVLSSHNMSKAAWGEVQNTSSGRRLFVRHWELGVFLSPSLLQCDHLVPWGVNSCDPPKSASVPLPYAFSPSPYEENDRPWAVDVLYSMNGLF